MSDYINAKRGINPYTGKPLSGGNIMADMESFVPYHESFVPMGMGRSGGKKQQMMAKGWFDDVMSGVSSVAKTVGDVIPVYKAVRGKGRSGSGLSGSGSQCEASGVKVYKARGKSGSGLSAGGLSAGKKVDGRKKRAMIVKKVMKEQGLNLPKASKYVKEHKLY
jgi:hypothetical protein